MSLTPNSIGSIETPSRRVTTVADCIETPSQSEKTKRDKQTATVRRILLILVRKSRDLCKQRVIYVTNRILFTQPIEFYCGCPNWSLLVQGFFRFRVVSRAIPVEFRWALGDPCLFSSPVALLFPIGDLGRRLRFVFTLIRSREA